MTVEYVQEFLVLAEVKNYSTAAELLFISQATLSRHIVAMEEELNCKLFHRTVKTVEITAAGQKFLPYAKHIAGIREQYTQAIIQKQKELNETLIIGYNVSKGVSKIETLLRSFQEKYPNITLNLLDLSTRSLKSAIRTNKCDVALLPGHLFLSNKADLLSEFVSREIFTNELVVVMHQDHPLASSKKIPLPMVQKETFVYSESQRLTVENIFDNIHIKLNHVCYSEDEHVLELLDSGLGIMLTWDTMIPKGLGAHCLIKPVDPPVYSKAKVIYSKTAQLTMAKMLFVKFAVSNSSN